MAMKLSQLLGQINICCRACLYTVKAEPKVAVARVTVLYGGAGCSGVSLMELFNHVCSNLLNRDFDYRTVDNDPNPR